MQFKMKLKSFLFILFLFFTNAIWSQAFQEADTQIPIKFQQSIEVCAKFNTMQDYEPSLFSGSTIYNIWGKRFSALGGIQVQKGDMQLTLSAFYSFFKSEKVSLQTGVIYNLNWLMEYSLTNNFLPCLYFEWKPAPFYTLEVNFDLLFKFRHLFIFGFNQHQLINTTLAVSIKSIFNLPKNFRLYLEFASFETFRYDIFCAPSYIAGVEYSINDSFDVALDVTIHYIDFFTLSAHYADTDIKLGVRYKW